MKTNQEIENEIYALLKGSALVAECGGAQRLTKTKRPLNSSSEDVRIKVLSSQTVGDKQVGIFAVQIFTAMQEKKGQMEENTKRTAQLASLAREVLTRYDDGNFRFNWRSQEGMELSDGKTYVIAILCHFEHVIMN